MHVRPMEIFSNEVIPSHLTIHSLYKGKINHKTGIEGTTGLWAQMLRTWTKKKNKRGSGGRRVILEQGEGS